MRHWTWCNVKLRIPILTSSQPQLILVYSGQYHIISNASIVNNCILIYQLLYETANHANVMHSMLISWLCHFSCLEGNIRTVSKILTSGNQFELVSIPYQLVCQFPGRHKDVWRQIMPIRDMMLSSLTTISLVTLVENWNWYFEGKYYTIIDFSDVDMRIYQPEKGIYTEVVKPKKIWLLRVDKSLYLPKLKSITV